MEILHSVFTPEGLFSLLTLSLLEIVLGIDNVIFVSIIVGKLPAQDHLPSRNSRIGFFSIMYYHRR